MSDTQQKPKRAARPKSGPKSTPEQELIDYISQFMPLTEAEAADILKVIKVKSYKKGTLLLKEGQVASLCYFILKGCVRQYYLVDGEEKTTEFYTEGQPITPYEGTYKRQPAKYYLSCVEDVLLSVGSPEQEAVFFEKFPRLEPARQMALAEELGKTKDSMSAFMLSSPEKRYLQLLETRPDLLDRVPQYQLASYLGVTAESLSRIRKRITGK